MSALTPLRRRGESVNKRKKVAWHKHLKAAKKAEIKRRGQVSR
jgi:hypothetical protein